MQVVSADGTRIMVHASGSGPDVLLVHGSAADQRDWGMVVPLLSGDHRLHAMDRRGRGASGDAPSYDLQREAEDVVAACRALGGPMVVAHSFGAVVALEAARLGAPIPKLVLYEPPIFPEPIPDELSALLDKLVADGDRVGALTTFMREAAGATDEEIAMMRSDATAWDAGVASAHTLAREVRADFAFRFEPARYKDIATPTLLLLGTESPPFFGEAIDAIGAALPDARVVKLPGQAHAAMAMAPELFVEKVRAFLG